jgi:hypothetical protein
MRKTTVLTALFFAVAAGAQELTFDPAAAKTSDAKVMPASGKALRIETGHKSQWPGVTLPVPHNKWDLSRRQAVELDVRNVGAEAVTVFCRVDNPGADGGKHCVTGNIALNPGSKGTLRVTFSTFPIRVAGAPVLVGMRGAPGSMEKFDPSNVTQLLVFVSKPKRNHAFEIANVRAAGEVSEVEPLDAKKFFPFIDEFGQFIHRDWPGKVHSESEFAARREAEEKDLEAHPGAADRDQYGGWKSGPQLKATGFFRAEKHQGKWWLVDPEGRLFWSHGADCVRVEAATPVTDREHYFRNLPERGSPFYWKSHWAPHGYYTNHSSYATYDFSSANLRRKYGADYLRVHAEITQRRLQSWGMNTIANWSDSGIYLLRKTPYTATLHVGGKQLEGSKGYWGKFADVFDPSFRASVQRAIEKQKGASADDPWCIGFFVDNELGWGNDTSLAVAALCSPPAQAAKKVFINDLKVKYRDIAALNEAWGVQHASWDALSNCATAPSAKKAGDDLRAFYTKSAETYFSTIRDELKKVAPNQLYLGCRFAWVNDCAARAAAKFCDVISYNRYEYSVEKLPLPDNLDRPLIIGEFHFGALDRGMFHTGLRWAANQQDRAQKYREYVESALRNPCLVGAHWFQYRDQATTGRGDGENYQIGLVDICDTPYPETIAALRAVGGEMYTYRLNP